MSSHSLSTSGRARAVAKFARELNEPLGRLGQLGLREPIPLPQRLCLLCAPKRIERVGSDAGAVLGPRVIASKNFVMSSESGFAKSERFRRLPAHEEQASQIVAPPIRIRMLRAERFFIVANARS